MLSFEAQQDIDEVDGGDPDLQPSTSGRDGSGGEEGEGGSEDERALISPGTISDVEQCLAYRGGMRMRLKVTAKFGVAPDGELDVEVGAWSASASSPASRAPTPQRREAEHAAARHAARPLPPVRAPARPPARPPARAPPPWALQLKRVVLYKEHWYGKAGLQRLDFKEAHNLATSCTKLPRPQPEQLEGTWDVFTAGERPHAPPPACPHASRPPPPLP
jgi:hypothetical protein